MIKTKYWIAAVALILIVSAVSAGAMLFGRADNAVARVVVDGEVIHTVDLYAVDEAYEFDVTTDLGTNRIRVERGRIRVVDADCPDRICVGMGWRENSALAIACLPHHLVIEIEGGGDDIDAVAGVAP